MHIRLVRQFLSSRCRVLLYTFILVWVFGLCAGILTALHAGMDTFHLMDIVACNRVSIVGFLFLIALPFLITVCTVYSMRLRLLIPLCFIRAFLFGFSVQGIMLSFGSRAWLLAFMLMFSTTCLLPLDCWLWIRCMISKKRFNLYDFLFYAAAAAFIAAIDYVFVSPFLVNVIFS